jgi:hypothetical protein
MVQDQIKLLIPMEFFNLKNCDKYLKYLIDNKIVRSLN